MLNSLSQYQTKINNNSNDYIHIDKSNESDDQYYNEDIMFKDANNKSISTNDWNDDTYVNW